MSTQNSSYHHGDLRRGLMEAAARLLREQGVAGLSMRRLADEVGVSRSAPYHHFKDKHELLCAIAQSGFADQDEMLTSLPEASLPERFSELVRRYIRFAYEHPEQYDLMYGREIWKTAEATPDLQQAARGSFKRWLDEIESLQAGHVLPPDIPTLRLAQVSWATLHGLCRLLIDGVYVNSDDIEAMGQTAVELLLRGNH